MYINPYESVANGTGQWLRTNFHTHSGARKGDNCGIIPLKDCIAVYKDCGYQVLAITNHDSNTDLTAVVTESDMLLINGYEYSKEKHMVCIGGRTVVDGNHQEAIDSCIGEDGFVIICHPHLDIDDYWPAEDIKRLNGYVGIEIYNSVIPRLAGRGLATDVWDDLLSSGRLVWGFANDDFHRWFDLGNSWNMVYGDKSYDSVKAAIKSGCFYGSTGLKLKSLILENEELHMAVDYLNNYAGELQYDFIGSNSRLLARIVGERADCKLNKSEPYVRICVTAPDGSKLWTQPIYDNNFFKV